MTVLNKKKKKKKPKVELVFKEDIAKEELEQVKKKRRIVHIHFHSIFSLADAMNKPKETARLAKQLGIDTIILTDHGTISGVIQFKKACDEEGIKFIPACEMYEAPDRTITTQDDCRGWNKASHITMIPVNNKGWADLQQMIADSNNYIYYAPKAIPRTDFKYIEENNLGGNIIATTGCMASVTSKLILDGKVEEAKQVILKRNQIFYRYFLEIQDNGSREQEIINQALLDIHKETGVPLVYAKDVHYLRPDDKAAHHALVAIGRKQSVDQCQPYIGTNTYHMASADEVYQWADDNNIPHSALENTCWIADECNVTMEFGKNLMPEYPFCEEGYTPNTYLKKLLYDNMIEYMEETKKRGYDINVSDYIKRVESEFRVLAPKKFSSYFLILWDILLWATDRKKWMSYPQNKAWLNKVKKKKRSGKTYKPNAKYEFYPQFFVGPGRGSAAGSMTAFLLGITRLDPIEYGLMFERFLNPYRKSPPDIDVDFPGDNHDLLLDFVAQRYGRDKTAQILTFTKFKIKSAIDKICKALMKTDDKGKVIAYGYSVADEVKKVLEITGDQGKMPDQKDCTYKDMMEISQYPEKYARYGPTLPKFVEASKEFRRLMTEYPELNEYLPRIEGAIDTSGVHPGGVIISNRPIVNDCPTVMPTEKSKAVLPITMWDYPDCESVGLLKMDLLRTATLRGISICLDLIEENTGERIDMYKIGRDDSATFETISRGETHGLFQITGRGITQYTKQVSPTKQEEVIDILALFRPGPLDAKLENGNTIAQQYVLNGGRSEKEYMKDVHKELREIMKPSRGQMVYQEQIMNTVQKVAAYNLGHADSFRRVIGKKKIDEMSKLYDEFMFGHKYVVKKFQQLLDAFETMQHYKDDEGNTCIKIKSDYNGHDILITKGEVEYTVKANKKAMESFEILGAVNMGYDKKFAHNLFEQMAAFAGYAFNKSHSACYADETYQTAWLKTHYPIEFMTAILTLRGDKKDKTLDNLKEAKRMGVKILPPHINHSNSEFRPQKEGIRFGLVSIAGVGAKAVERIIRIRGSKPFTSFDEFLERCVNSFVKTPEEKSNPVNRGVIRTLIEAGCFDDFEPNRYKLLNYYNFTIRKDKVWDGTYEDLQKDKAKSNHSFPYDEKKFNKKLLLQMEHNLIGIYVSGSPYDGLPHTSMQDMEISRGRYNQKTYDIGGRISKPPRIITAKNNREMAFIELETKLDPIDITVFNNVFAESHEELYKDNIVIVRGYKKKDFYKGEEKESFIATKILVKEARKLKQEMGIESADPPKKRAKKKKEEPVFEPLPKKDDPVADLFDEFPKERKASKGKKRSKKLDLEKYVS